MFKSFRSQRWLGKRRSITRTIGRRLRLDTFEDRIAPAGVTLKGTELDPALVVRNQASTLTDRTDIRYFGPTNTSSVDPGRNRDNPPDLASKLPLRFEATDFYLTSAEGISLSRMDNQLSVKLTGGAAELQLLTAPDGPLAGFSTVRTLGSGDVFVLQGADGAQAIDRLAGQIGEGWAGPVFTTLDGKTWLVSTNEVIVKLNDPADAVAMFSGPDFAGFRPLLGTPDTFVATMRGDRSDEALHTANSLWLDDRVRYAEPDFWQSWQKFFTPDDPTYPSQWHLDNTGQALGNTADADIDAPEAWDKTKGSGQVIAIIDDGIELTHPDLAPNLFINTKEQTGKTKQDDDGNGWVDDFNGWDFSASVAGDNDPAASSTADAHGTATSGLAVAKGNNTTGVAGVAYEAKFLPVRIFGTTTATDAGIAQALYYAAGRTASGTGSWSAATVISNSWGGGARTSVIDNAVQWARDSARGGKGVPIFWAAGNGAATQYPATLSAVYNNVVTVGGSTNADFYRGYAAGHEVSLVAPTDDFDNSGTGITTTDRVGANGYNGLGDYTDTASSAFGGTSASAPIAAGVGALVLAMNPNLTAAQVRAHLQNTADTIEGGAGGYDERTGHSDALGSGRVNAGTAVNGIGTRELDVLFAGEPVADKSTLLFPPEYPGLSEGSLFIRNQGDQDLILSNLKITGASEFTIAKPFTDSTLSVGETTYVTIRYTPSGNTLKTAALTFDTNDTSEPNFTMNLEGDAFVQSVYGDIVYDVDGSKTKSADDFGLQGGTLYFDLNNNDTYDLNAPVVYNSTDVPLAIPDPGVVFSKLTVSGFTGTLGDVNVTLDISHTWDSDLDLYLLSPNGTLVLLAAGVGGDGDNFTNTTFDDEATTFIANGAVPFTGTFLPFGWLAYFDGATGADVNGDWFLVANDVFDTDAGTINSWSMSLSSTPDFPTTSEADGHYFFEDVAAGTYTVRADVGVGLVATFPTGAGEYSATVTSFDSKVANLDFGQLPPNSVGGYIYEDRDLTATHTAPDVPRVGAVAYLDLDTDGVLDIDPAIDFGGGTTGTIVDGAQNDFYMDLSGITGTVTDINVTLDITHSTNTDLYAFLIAPTGDLILLVGAIGGSNFTSTTFDDEATQDISFGTAPYTGSFQPVEPLSTFDYLSDGANGRWFLVIIDNVTGNVGTLNSWTLSISQSFESPNPTIDSGLYAWFNLPVGTYDVRNDGNAGAGYTYSVPVSSKHTVTVNNDVTFDRDFGRYQPNSITGRVYEDNDGDGVIDVGEAGLPSRTVYLDSDNDGILDASTASTTFTSTDVSKAIPDAGNTSSILNVSGWTGPVTDVNVKLSITHTWDADIDAYLKSPTGVIVELTTDNGGNGDNYTNTVFDDQAAGSVTAGLAPFTGSFRPEGSLADFNGFDPNGTWTLMLADDEAQDKGTLTAWSITLTKTTGEPQTTTDGNGDYVFANQSPATYNIRTVVPSGWNELTPVGGKYSDTLTVGSTLNMKNFGQAEQNAIYGNTYMDYNLSKSLDTGDLPISVLVYDDTNNNSALDRDNFAFTGPATLADVGTSTLFMPVSFAGTVTDLNVKLNLTHSLDRALNLWLTGPTGTRVLLSLGNGGATGANFTNTVFDDQAATVISAGTAPFTGSFQPEGKLSDFNGQNAVGVWMVEFIDAFTQSVGILNSCELVFNGGGLTDELTTASDAYGNYVLAGLAAGSHNIRRQIPTGLYPVEPTGDVHVVNLVANQTVQNKNFGHSENAPAIPAVPPQASSITIDDGTAQRSMIQSLVVTFNEPVTFVGTAAAAFDLQRLATSSIPAPAGAVTLAVNPAAGPASSYTITFNDPTFATQFGNAKSLIDGKYQLTLNANQIKSAASGLFLDGDGNGSGGDDKVVNFNRLYGDGDGNAIVNQLDFNAFRNAFNNGPSNTWDYEANGNVTQTDFTEFRNRFNLTP